jgi:hypothetical protein
MGVVVLFAVGCGGSNSGNDGGGDAGGIFATGGNSSSGSGGSPGTGGKSNGGSPGTGGKGTTASTGGFSGSGGAAGATGGKIGSGGSAAGGGTATGTGGKATGGAAGNTTMGTGGKATGGADGDATGGAIGTCGVDAGTVTSAGNPNGSCSTGVPAKGRSVDTSNPTTVVGTGTAASCAFSQLQAAATTGGIITFNCGGCPVTIPVTATLNLPTTKNTVIDGGNLITLDGGNAVQILQVRQR